MEKLLTVVVPSYNVEKYLEETLESFVIQEIMDDLEVLIVNDGSKDRTPEIGAAYEKRYPQTFRLIFERKRRTWFDDQPGDRGSERDVL